MRITLLISVLIFSFCSLSSVNAQETKKVLQQGVSNKLGQPTLLFYFAHWCGYCHRMIPAIEAMQKKYQGQVFFYFADMDTDEGKRIAKAYRKGSGGIPYTQFYDKNGKLLGDNLGALSIQQLESKIKIVFGI